MASLVKFQCQMCLYASNNKADVEKHQEKMHNNPMNTISQFGRCKQGHDSSDGSEDEDDGGRYEFKVVYCSDDESGTEDEDNGDDDSDNDVENIGDGDVGGDDSDEDDEVCGDDDDVGSYENLVKLFKAFSNFMIPWYDDFEVHCENIRNDTDNQDDRKECIAKCIKYYARVKCQMAKMCDLANDRLETNDGEESIDEEAQMETDDDSEREVELEEEDEKTDHHTECCMKTFLGEFENVFEGNKWAKKELRKMEDKEQLAIDKVYFDKEIDALKSKNVEEDSDTSEDEDQEMDAGEEGNLGSNDEKLKEYVLKLKKAVGSYESEKKPSDYFKDSSKCNNDTMRLLGFYCNRFMREIEKKGVLLGDVDMAESVKEIADPGVLIQRKRELLMEPQVGDGIMKDIKNIYIPNLMQHLVKN